MARSFARADHELAVQKIAPTTEGALIYLHGLGRMATVTDIGEGEIGAVCSDGSTVLIRIVGRNPGIRA